MVTGSSGPSIVHSGWLELVVDFAEFTEPSRQLPSPSPSAKLPRFSTPSSFHGVTASFSNSTVNPDTNGTSVLTLKTSSSTPVGTYIPLLVATGGGVTHSTIALQLNVEPKVTSPPPLSVGDTHPYGLAVADFNGDGKPDIAVSSFDTTSIAVSLNNGDGTFATPITNTVSISNGLGNLAVGDFNEDGKPDLVIDTIDGGAQDNIVLPETATAPSPSRLPSQTPAVPSPRW